MPPSSLPFMYQDSYDLTCEYENWPWILKLNGPYCKPKSLS